MPVQPISVPPVCYLEKMEPKDPKDYLWTNIAKKAGLPAGKTQTVWKKIGSDELPKTNLQRIEQSGRTTTETLLALARVMGCEVWELLVPPDGQASEVTKPSTQSQSDLHSAVQTIAVALGALSKDDRQHMLDALARYAADPNQKPAALEYILECLGGAGHSQAFQRRNQQA